MKYRESDERLMNQLHKEAEQTIIPERLEPEQIKILLEAADRNKKGVIADSMTKYSKALAAAAAICFVIGCTALAGWTVKDKSSDQAAGESSVRLEETDAYVYEVHTYEEIYASMEKEWEEQSAREYYEYANHAAVLETVREPMDGALAKDASEMETNTFGNTNVQTAGVDEGDFIKNDGRYLYQIVNEYTNEQSIQIVDTKDGLKELVRIDGFENIAEFYVWEELLVVIEYKQIECIDYHQIFIIDISDRAVPIEKKVFTLQGMYSSSRIADGYFYGFSRYYANPGSGEDDYDSYIPTLDGARLSNEEIYLPEKSNGTSYLVIVSVDLRNPSEFVQTAGIVSNSEQYYVSADNMYVTYQVCQEQTEGWRENKTAIMRFSYGEGAFSLEAEGEIQGSLNNSFSMDEYQDHLRVVATVDESYLEEVTDNRTGLVIGMDTIETRRTNALYILDETLAVTGKIEGLAEDERIYSARFFGDTGYFVTFRQTDPLFAVDLSDPSNPLILSELKVSGFSEYLHFYGEDRLFGLGMEADEETGRQEGMKLSMFDISDPGNVNEISRLHMEDYYYSEALYNHHAILIHPSKNIIGFEMEGMQDNAYRKEYFIYTYENETFIEKFRIDTKTEEGWYGMTRGTFIGDVFYLMMRDGAVKSYDLNTGELLDTLA